MKQRWSDRTESIWSLSLSLFLSMLARSYSAYANDGLQDVLPSFFRTPIHVPRSVYQWIKSFPKPHDSQPVHYRPTNCQQVCITPNVDHPFLFLSCQSAYHQQIKAPLRPFACQQVFDFVLNLFYKPAAPKCWGLMQCQHPKKTPKKHTFNILHSCSAYVNFIQKCYIFGGASAHTHTHQQKGNNFGCAKKRNRKTCSP